MQNVSRSNQRFEYIDALRGIAIIGVIFAHAASITHSQGPLKVIGDTAGMGVQLFFVISAFTIFHMLTKHAAQESRPIRNFFIRRLFRIIPVYWFGIIFYSLIFGLKSRGWLPGPEMWHYPLHITLTNVLHPLTQSSVVPGGWSISCEVLFYMSVPLWFKWIRNLRQAYGFMLVCVFILPIATKLLSKFMNPYWAGIDPFLVKLYWDRFPLMTLGSFSFGIVLFFLLKENRFLDFFRDRSVHLCTIMSTCLMLASLMTTYPKLPAQFHIYCLLFMVIALMLSIRPIKILVNPATIFMGRISYSAYLFHFFVLKTLTDYLSRHTPNIMGHQLLYLGVVYILGTLLTVPLAWCGYRLIESNSIELSKKIIRFLETKEQVLRTEVCSQKI